MLAHDGAGVGNDDAAGAADGGNALFLGVKVDHSTGANLGLVERLGTDQASLLVGGEYALEGRMGNRIVVEHGKHKRDGDTVVGARVVPLAVRTPSLTTRSIPSVVKSCSTEPSLSHTMSM